MKAMALSLLVIVIAALGIADAFLPLASRHRRLPVVVSHRSASNKNLNEFDYLLQETSAVTPPTPNAANRRNLAIRLASDQTTILASSGFAGPSTAATLQEQVDAYDTNNELDMDDPYKAQINKIQKYQQQQEQQLQQPLSFETRIKRMDFQELILLVVIPSVALFAAGRWGYNRVAARLSQTTNALLDSFAREMIYHDGDYEEMKLTVRAYQNKLLYLGPLRREKLLQRYLAAYAKRMTITPQAVRSLSFVLFTVFGLDDVVAANTLVNLCRALGTDKISSAGKLLFLGSRVISSVEGKAALNPIKDLIMSTYRDESVAADLIETSQTYVELFGLW
jgi:hypothetical protein